MTLNLSDPAFLACLSSGFSPNVITTLLWLDPRDSSTYTLSSGLISSIRDKKNNGIEFTQSSSTARPALLSSASAINGLPSIVFDGNDSLVNNTFSWPLEYSIFAVGRRSSGSGYARLIHANSNGDVVAFFGALDNNFATFFGTGQISWNDTTANTPNISVASNCIMSIVKGNGVGLAIPYVNSTAQNAKNGTTVTTTGIILGAYSNQQFWNGPLGELIIVPGLVSNATRANIVNYLTAGWLL